MRTARYRAVPSIGVVSAPLPPEIAVDFDRRWPISGGINQGRKKKREKKGRTWSRRSSPNPFARTGRRNVSPRGEKERGNVLRTALSHRLAKVQGFLFQAAFLRRVPTFLRLIAENLLLCFLQSTLYSTSKYLTGALGLRFRKILTELIHSDYFKAYVLGAGAAIRNFSPAFGKLMSKEQQLEGDYRQLHSRLRSHAESVAFYGGENREASHIKEKFEKLIKHLNIVLHDRWWFGMIQDFLLKYLGATVGVVLIIEPFFAGNLRPDASTLGRAEINSNPASFVLSLTVESYVVLKSQWKWEKFSLPGSWRIFQLSEKLNPSLLRQFLIYQIHQKLIVKMMHWLFKELFLPVERFKLNTSIIYYMQFKKINLLMPFSSQGNTLSESEVYPYSSRVIISSPEIDKKVPLPIVPQLQKPPRVLPHRVAVMFNVLVGYLCPRYTSESVFFMCLVGFTGTSVKYVLEQDKAAFIRLTGLSVLQSAANSFVAPTLRYNFHSFMSREGEKPGSLACYSSPVLPRYLLPAGEELLALREGTRRRFRTTDRPLLGGTRSSAVDFGLSVVDFDR
ncbi:hypothetical protein BHM03_00004726 [Ensete ventricosum]|nr:hypothetical protein BHM03_00004726 [Ensete ventricosum]